MADVFHEKSPAEAGPSRVVWTNARSAYSDAEAVRKAPQSPTHGTCFFAIARQSRRNAPIAGSLSESGAATVTRSFEEAATIETDLGRRFYGAARPEQPRANRKPPHAEKTWDQSQGRVRLIQRRL